MRLWVTGYRSYELSVFKDDDPKVKVIKYLLRKIFIQNFNKGLEWIISGGQLGVEQWALETALALKGEYPELKTSLIYPFVNFGNNWNDNNKVKLQTLESKVDFCASVSKKDYTSPRQLKNYQSFLLRHTDQALMIYDLEYPGKPKYDYQIIKRYEKDHNYPLQLIDMYELQEVSEEYQENHHQD